MIVLGREKLVKFMGKHAKARPPIASWLAETESATWKTPNDIKGRYRSADFLSGNRVIFNIGGNNFRLVVVVRYSGGIVVIDRVGTHADYDKWKLE
ncbi:type II toxin-antitoxin system HigB family toxin [Luteolibacter sp. Populi]|uniref:type II toxin-antitoxin system HigB family toxin n=1 Tax=Luteolibacter sp. Populi TaxID=3230487 RepID=UPI0034678017